MCGIKLPEVLNSQDIEKIKARNSKHGVKTLFKGIDYLRHNDSDKNKDMEQLIK